MSSLAPMLVSCAMLVGMSKLTMAPLSDKLNAFGWIFRSVQVKILPATVPATIVAPIVVLSVSALVLMSFNCAESSSNALREIDTLRVSPTMAIG